MQHRWLTFSFIPHCNCMKGIRGESTDHLVVVGTVIFISTVQKYCRSSCGDLVAPPPCCFFLFLERDKLCFMWDAVAVVFFVSFRQPPTLLCGLDSPRSARCLSDFPPDRVNPPPCCLVLRVSVWSWPLSKPSPHPSTPPLPPRPFQQPKCLVEVSSDPLPVQQWPPALYRHPVLLILPSFGHRRWKQPYLRLMVIAQILCDSWFIFSSPSCHGCQCVDSSYESFVSASPHCALSISDATS